MAQKEHHPRDLAVRVLTRVLSDRQPLDEALAALVAETQTPARAWLQEVCAGTLRWKGRLDLAIDSGALKKKPSGWLRKVLLLAAYQLIAQDRVNPGAIVSETVSEVKRREGEAPAKFANALLRKVGEHAVRWKEMGLTPNTSSADSAAWASLPEWLWKRLEKDYGREWAEKYARASLERPAIWIRAKEAPGFAESGPVPGSFRVTEGGAIPDKEGFAEGHFFVQDISSQFLIDQVTSEIKKVDPARPNWKALDLCAAPGGKSVGLAWSGMEVTATDRDEARLTLLRQTVNRVGQGIQVVTREKVSDLDPQDLVWVDAPCTGTGILRRHPDVRWLRKETDVESLVKVQQQLLQEAWNKVRPGGFLAYSVCSVLRQEGPEALKLAQFDRWIAREWLLVPQEAPHGDGFYGALIRKPV